MAHSGKTITFATDLLPNEDNVYSLGSNSKKWKIVGNLTGNATNDGDGNEIKSTYLKLDGSNNMTADVNIIAGDTDKFVNFWYNTGKKAGASWRVGMKGSGSSDTNYFSIDSGTSTTSATTWNTTLRIGQNTYDIGISGHFYPITTNTKNLGTSDNKWANVNATNLNGALYVTAHTNTTNGKQFYPWFSTAATSGNLSAQAYTGFYLYETVTSGAISQIDLCMGKSSLTGSITLWAGGSYYCNLKPTTLGANRNYTLPNITGMMVILNGSTAKGSDTKPVKVAATGEVQECSTYAGGTAVTLNGTSKAASVASFYAPTGAGTSGYVLKSSGSGAPDWAVEYHVELISLIG